MGYAIGVILSGNVADLFGNFYRVLMAGVITLISYFITQVRMDRVPSSAHYLISVSPRLTDSAFPHTRIPAFPRLHLSASTDHPGSASLHLQLVLQALYSVSSMIHTHPDAGLKLSFRWKGARV